MSVYTKYLHLYSSENMLNMHYSYMLFFLLFNIVDKDANTLSVISTEQ